MVNECTYSVLLFLFFCRLVCMSPRSLRRKRKCENPCLRCHSKKRKQKDQVLKIRQRRKLYPLKEQVCKNLTNVWTRKTKVLFANSSASLRETLLEHLLRECSLSSVFEIVSFTRCGPRKIFELTEAVCTFNLFAHVT